MKTRTWRKEPVKSARTGEITSWRLVAGRGRERVRLNLGDTDEATAERCAQAMNEEEWQTIGT